MNVTVQYWSYFRDHAGCSEETIELPEGALLKDALNEVYRLHAELKRMEKSTLTAVGVDYQTHDCPLKQGDTVSLFPPVQGG